MAENLVPGWTEPLDFTLLEDDIAADLTGQTVVIDVIDKNGTAVAPLGATTVPDPTAGHVRYSPTGTEFTVAGQPYGVRWKVTDGSGKVAFFPNGKRDQWKVAA